MDGAPSIRVVALASALPPLVGNDHWPAEVVAAWTAAQRLMSTEVPPDIAPTDGVAAVLAAMQAVAADPFRGIRTRAMMGDDDTTVELEVRAAAEAITRAGVAPEEIGLLVQQSSGNHYISPQNACLVHHRLGLPRDCLVLGVEAGCDSFLMQLTMAEALIAAGRARYGLLIQSSGNTKLADRRAPYSAWFGDGATAQVVAPSPRQRGLLGRAHYTDGAFFYANSVGVPGGAWAGRGRPTIIVEDPAMMRRLLLTIADLSRDNMAAALAGAGIEASHVNYYASHQATVWLGEVTRIHNGFVNARSYNTCATHGSVGACNVPLVLEAGLDRGLLRRDDVVAMQTGGAGMTYSAMLMRWGA